MSQVPLEHRALCNPANILGLAGQVSSATSFPLPFLPSSLLSVSCVERTTHLAGAPYNVTFTAARQLSSVSHVQLRNAMPGHPSCDMLSGYNEENPARLIENSGALTPLREIAKRTQCRANGCGIIIATLC